VNVDGAAHSIIVCRDSPNSENGQPADRKMGDDRAYHEAREQIERRAAKKAASVQSRRIHQELAEAHSAMATHRGWPRGH
jgi:hypothetical protein